MEDPVIQVAPTEAWRSVDLGDGEISSLHVDELLALLHADSTGLTRTGEDAAAEGLHDIRRRVVDETLAYVDRKLARDERAQPRWARETKTLRQFEQDVRKLLAGLPLAETYPPDPLAALTNLVARFVESERLFEALTKELADERKGKIEKKQREEQQKPVKKSAEVEPKPELRLFRDELPEWRLYMSAAISFELTTSHAAKIADAAFLEEKRRLVGASSVRR